MEEILRVRETHRRQSYPDAFHSVESNVQNATELCFGKLNKSLDSIGAGSERARHLIAPVALGNKDVKSRVPSPN